MDELRAIGFSLRLDGDDLVASGPRGVLSTELRQRLADSKPDLVAKLVRDRDGGGPSAAPRAGPVPLGPVQRWMWMMDQMDPESTLLNLAGAWLLSGAFNEPAFRLAFADIMRRHEIMRTRVEIFDGTASQFVEPALAYELPLDDLTSIPEGDRHRRMMEIIEDTRRQPFVLSSAPLFRARILRLGPEEHVFLFVPHHVMWDGWSWDVLHGELEALYRAHDRGQPHALSELPFQYADFCEWHNNLLDGPESVRHLDFWRQALKGAVEPLRFSRSHEGEVGALGGGPAERRVLELNREVLDGLSRVAREEDATLFMALLAAWGIWLFKWSGQRRFGVGVPIQGRTHPGTELLLGAMVNTIVIPMDVGRDDSFRDVLRVVRDRCIDAYEHQDFPFDVLVRDLAGASRETSLFQALFSYQDVRNRPRRLGNLAVSQIHVDAGVSDCDVGCGFMVTDERTVALLDFRSTLFDAATVNRMATGFEELIRDAGQNPDRETGRLVVSAADSRLRDVDHLFGAATVERGSDGMGGVPLTSHQEGMWFLDRVAGHSVAHHLVERLRIRGALNSAELGHALRGVVARHDALRLRFPLDHGYPVMEAVAGPPELETLEASSLQAAQELLDGRAQAPFDLEVGPLLRATLVRSAAGEEFLLQVVCHNLIADQRSMAVLVEELGAAYGSMREGRSLDSTPASRYLDHASRAREELASEETRHQLDWWLARLPHAVTPLSLPLDRPRTNDLVRPASSLELALDEKTAEALRRFAQRADVPEAAVLLASWWLTLKHLGGSDDFMIGLVVSSVPSRLRAADTIGPWQNTLLLSLESEGEFSFVQFCRGAAAELSEILERAGLPFEKLVAAVNPLRGAGSNPFFQSQVVLESHRPGTFDIEGLEARRIYAPRLASPLDLSLQLNDQAIGDWAARLDFASDVLDAETASRILNRFQLILRAGLEAPDGVLRELPQMSGEERSWLETSGTGDRRDVAHSVPVHIGRIATQAPDRQAVTGRDDSLTYGELWSRSGMLAQYLAARGVDRGTTVGVCFERTPDLVVALLGIWRAGAAYLPLDPEYPRERLAFMVSDSRCGVVVTDGRQSLPETGAETVVLKDVEGAVDEPVPLPELSGSDLAYVIYTSGSTGRPKGVEVTHENLANFTQSMSREPGLSEEDALVAVTTLSFDIAGLELWLPLYVGGRVELADEAEVRDGEGLKRRLEACGATIMQATPSTWRLLLDGGWEGRLKKALCGGEAFPAELVGALLERADEVWNLYGPTETTVWSTAYRVLSEPEGSVPIGRPIDNTHLYVMGAAGAPTAPGVPGELWIGGAGVARGYRDRPELTDERFVADPIVEGGRVYRTGDLVRWRNDRSLEHLGRTDHQVKVHGHRVELGEIEAAMVAHDEVRQAVATVHGMGADARLVAYVVMVPGKSIMASEMRRSLRGRLPDFMIPGVVTELEEMPLTPNGKIDRRALPDPFAGARRQEYRAPETPEEILVAEVWKRLLGSERIGAQDNFFEIGGHSLLAIRVVAVLLDEFGLRIDPRSLFFMTLAQVAASAASNSS